MNTTSASVQKQAPTRGLSATPDSRQDVVYVGEAFNVAKAKACRWYFEAASYTCFVQQVEPNFEFLLRVSSNLLFIDLILGAAVIYLTWRYNKKEGGERRQYARKSTVVRAGITLSRVADVGTNM